MNNRIKLGLSILALCLFLVCSPAIVYIFATMFSKPSNSLLSCNSEREARQKGVYICSIKPINHFVAFNDSISIETQSGWLEKIWFGHTSGWVWPSNTLAGVGDGFTIHLIPTGKTDKISQHTIYSPDCDSWISYSHNDFNGSLGLMPHSDSIKYYVLREGSDKFNLKDFSQNHILDSFYVVLDRSK